MTKEEIMRVAEKCKAEGRCPLCGKKVFKSELRNAIEVNEYNISGIGHCCQPYIFRPDGSVK